MTKQSGFTLVELAIALMVIGLLIGGVLKGQELIENAKITRTVKDLKGFDTAIMIFRNTYNALPGDIKRPSRIPNCSTSPCTLEGNGNGQIKYETGRHDERGPFWFHLYNSGLISSMSTDGTMSNVQYSPLNTFGGDFRLTYLSESAIMPGSAHRWSLGRSLSALDHVLTCNLIQRIDGKMDDGKPLTGDVTIYSDTNNAKDCYDEISLEYKASSSATIIFIRSSAT